MKSRYALKVYNGRYKLYVDGLVMLSWNQIDFQGYYAYKDDHSLFGITIYTKHTKIHCGFKTREVWEGVLKLLDENI